MQIIYRTIDGKEFDNEADACYHENNIEEGIIMLDREGNLTNETCNALFVWLRDVEANLAFHAMAREQGDNCVSSITEGEDWGLYYWEEGYDEYRWVDNETLNGLLIMDKLIKKKGGRV